MIRDITLGQYFVADSFVHKIDPRAKILLLVYIIVMIFTTQNVLSLLLITFLSILIMLASKIPLRMYLKNIKVIIPIIIFTAILNVFYTNTGVLLLNVWKIQIYSGGVLRAVYMAVRVLLLILTSSVLTYTTTPNDLTDAIERLLKPLKYIGLGNAVHTMSMMMTIALRFIPTLIEETDKIMNAQKARGADMESGGLIKKVKALLPILIPLLLSAVRRAYELAEAMECRCYNGGVGRTRMKQLHLTVKDYISFAVFTLFLALIITSNCFISFGVI